MATLITKRLGFMLFTMIVVSLILFLLLDTELAGDPAARVLGQFASADQKSLWLAQHGYNDPLMTRYIHWVSGFVQGDLGESNRYRAPVADILGPRLWNTAILGFWTFAIMIPLSLLFGILSGMCEGSKLDRTLSIIGIVTTSVPEFASSVFFAVTICFWLEMVAWHQWHGRRI